MCQVRCALSTPPPPPSWPPPNRYWCGNRQRQQAAATGSGDRKAHRPCSSASRGRALIDPHMQQGTGSMVEASSGKRSSSRAARPHSHCYPAGSPLQPPRSCPRRSPRRRLHPQPRPHLRLRPRLRPRLRRTALACPLSRPTRSQRPSVLADAPRSDRCPLQRPGAAGRQGLGQLARSARKRRREPSNSPRWERRIRPRATHGNHHVQPGASWAHS
jgi:hypothetical protein